VAILNSAYEDALEDSGDAYWSKKQYGMIINILQKKKAGTVNLYDRLLEKLVLLFSSLSWPALPFTKSSSSASAARKSTQHLTLEDLDAMDEDDDASSSSSRMKPEGIVRSKSLRSRRQQTSRLHGISTAPAWTKVIPTACKHGAPKPPQRKISRSSSAREMKRSPATAAAGLRSMIVGARFPYTRID
jgi:hypothetical protein